MGRACTICSSDNRHGIEEALRQQEPYRRIASRFEVSTAALQRHRRDHVTEGERLTFGKDSAASRARARGEASAPTRAHAREQVTSSSQHSGRPRTREQGADVPHKATEMNSAMQRQVEFLHHLKELVEEAGVLLEKMKYVAQRIDRPRYAAQRVDRPSEATEQQLDERRQQQRIAQEREIVEQKQQAAYQRWLEQQQAGAL